MIRNTFMTELEQLKQDITALGKDIQQAFHSVYDAMAENCVPALKDLIDADDAINAKELEINEQATLVIAKQQPVASDLRHIIVCLKISSDLERMGDLSVDMAKAYMHMSSREAFLAYKEDLDKIQASVTVMIDRVLEAYASLDVLKAQQIAGMDDEIDRAYGELVKALFKSDYSADQTAQLAFIARYMERIGDYCTNIAEWIIYEVNGKRFDLN
ncbi:phosphate signaling complex protein PhoU [Alkalicoccus luteus]|uniref:Phosphate-specific transport system accessory protein PhoU n=1 Tax=Alkalicoccus luteus TaxID=1237094 RepID=A0A969PPV5_9BACI|nr:phosphate signaling complex protein PhoU [Alkalicoccus luteus]NJP36779.1 phosphate signaling complex protein PhoU [Alkalicoccus luteus]